MSADTFEQQIEAAHRRLTALEAQVGDADGAGTASPAALAEFSTALEELHVASEELRQQNEELLAAREALEVERQRYRDLFEFAPDGYLVTDADGTIQEANQAAALLLGVRQDFLEGKPSGRVRGGRSAPGLRRVSGAVARRTPGTCGGVADHGPAAERSPVSRHRDHGPDPRPQGAPRRPALAAAGQYRAGAHRSGPAPVGGATAAHPAARKSRGPGRRDRARFQQPPHGGPRLRRAGPPPPSAGRAGPRRRRADRHGRASGGGPHRPDVGLLGQGHLPRPTDPAPCPHPGNGAVASRLAAENLCPGLSPGGGAPRDRGGRHPTAPGGHEPAHQRRRSHRRRGRGHHGAGRLYASATARIWREGCLARRSPKGRTSPWR